MMRGLVFILCLVCALGSAPARAEWLRAESPNFIVYSEGSESRLRERIALLESFDALLRVFTSVEGEPAPNKLHVYIVRGPRELRQIRPVREGTGGFYSASAHGIAAIVDSRANAGANEVLFHEYAHHFMMQYAASAYPAWYVEGFAEYFSTAVFGPNGIDVGRFSEGRIYSVIDQGWLPTEQVLFGDGAGLSREQTARFYAQSWLIVHYFFSTAERQAALRRYLATAHEEDPRAALQSATGMDAERFGEELRNYIRGRRISYRRLLPDGAAPQPQITVTRLSPAADSLMPYAAGLRLGIPEDQAADVVHQVRTAAGRHADDPFARHVLAHAEALHGNLESADRLLDALLAEAPDDADLLYLKGMRHLRAAEEGEDWESEAREARRWFTRAHRADQNHFQTLYRYAQALRSEDSFDTDNTADVLLLSHQLAPQVTEIRMNAAAMLIGRNATDLAEALLRPLAADPHNAGLRDAARQMMEAARQRSSRGSAEPGNQDPFASPGPED